MSNTEARWQQPDCKQQTPIIHHHISYDTAHDHRSHHICMMDKI